MSPSRVVAWRADATVPLLCRMDRGGRKVSTLILAAVTASIFCRSYAPAPLEPSSASRTIMGTRKKYTGHPPAAVPHDTGLSVPPRVLRFLNSLPVGGDLVEWLMEFREALRQLLGDVDRVAVRVNISKDVDSVNKFNWLMNVNQFIYTGDKATKIFNRPNSNVVKDRAGLSKVEGARMLLEEMKRLNISLHEYQVPYCYDYHSYGEPNLGSLVLFRRNGAKPISLPTLRMVESLEPFFVFLFTSLKSRYFYHQAGAAIFDWSVYQIKSEMKLTDREVEVLILRLYGLTFNQIAKELFLSHATVRKHLHTLLRKGNARNAIEMFTRRFLQGAEGVLAGGKEGISKTAAPETEGEGDILLW